jgi:hypothetical protein
MLSPAQMLRKITIGNDAGWALTFHHESEGRGVIDEPILTLSREDYYASIEAALPDGFGPGKYTFRIEGLTDRHYAEIKGKEPATVVRLYLYWRDANASVAGDLANVAGFVGGPPSAAALEPARVAELTIKSVARKVGTRNYECVIEAGERVYMKALNMRAETLMRAPNTLEMIRFIALETGFEFEPRPGPEAEAYGFNVDGSLPSPAGASPELQRRKVDPGTTFAAALKELGKRIEDAVQDARGRGVLLIRNGMLVVGKRPIPPAVTPPHDLTHATGFIDSESVAASDEKDKNKKPADPEEEEQKPARDQFKITLKGRPDIRPGDVVRFQPAVEDVPVVTAGVFRAAAGSFLGPLVGDSEDGPRVTLYVNTVEHRLSRDTGFATTLVGVVIKDGDRFEDAWDKDSSTGARGNSGGTANRAAAAAQAVKKKAEAAAADARQPDVAEIRAMNSARPGLGTEEPPAQTLTVWQGLAPSDGHPNRARRLAIARKAPAPLEGVPYTSPFAWGRCGLVLPRYPGTRTLLAFRDGEADDPVELGALWESGHGPESEPGDWWLILPVGVPRHRRASIEDSEAAPPEYAGKSTHDLIDADGRRTIEVGELTIRVGQGNLPEAGKRPAFAEESDSITIEHTKEGSKITMRPDGTIVIDAAKTLELNARNGDIEMNAVRVKVHVDAAMEVS